MFIDRVRSSGVSDTVERWAKNANIHFSKVERIGNVCACLLDTEGKEHFVTFSNWLLLSDHAQNLINVSKLSQKGMKVEIGKESKMAVPNGITFPIIKNENLFLLEAKFPEFCGTWGENTNSLLWHQRDETPGFKF